MTSSNDSTTDPQESASLSTAIIPESGTAQNLTIETLLRLTSTHTASSLTEQDTNSDCSSSNITDERDADYKGTIAESSASSFTEEDNDDDDDDNDDDPAETAYYEWFEANSYFLVIAIGQTIRDVDEAARNSGGKPCYDGGELDLKGQHLLIFFQHFKEVVRRFRDWGAKNNYTLPEAVDRPEVQEDAPEDASQVVARFKVEQDPDHPWSRFDLQRDLIPACWDYNMENINTAESLYRNRGCMYRVGHVCPIKKCSEIDEELNRCLENFQDVKIACSMLVEALEKSRPPTSLALSKAKLIEKECNFGLARLNDGIENTYKKAKDTGKANTEEIPQHDNAAASETAGQGPLSDFKAVRKFVTDNYGSGERLYYMLFIVSLEDEADSCAKYMVSYEDWRATWGQPSLQLKACSVPALWYEANMEADYWTRAGISPPLFVKQVLQLFNEWARVPSTPDCQLPPNYRELDDAERLRWAYGCAAQVLEIRASLRDYKANDLERCNEPGFDWASWGVGEPDEDTKQFRKHKMYKRCKRFIKPDHYYPPGYCSATEENQPSITKAWIENVIKPLTDWFFVSSEWKKPLRPWGDLTDEEREEEEAHQAVMKAGERSRRWFSLGVMAEYKDAPHLLTKFASSSRKEQRRLALEFKKTDEVKRNQLVLLAKESLLSDLGGFGMKAMRCSQSPAILKAATSAWDRQGDELYPWGDSPFCECEKKDDHKMAEIGIVAHKLCEALDALEDSGAA